MLLTSWLPYRKNDITAVSAGKFFRENETENRLPFSENLKLKVGCFSENCHWI